MGWEGEGQQLKEGQRIFKCARSFIPLCDGVVVVAESGSVLRNGEVTGQWRGPITLVTLGEPWKGHLKRTEHTVLKFKTGTFFLHCPT